MRNFPRFVLSHFPFVSDCSKVRGNEKKRQKELNYFAAKTKQLQLFITT